MKAWNISINQKTYEVVFNGRSIYGKGKFLVDGQKVVCDPILVRKVGQFYVLSIDGEELLVKLNRRGKLEDIIQNGRYLESGSPWEDEVERELGPGGLASNPLVAKERAGMGSFLTFVALTFVNLLLIWFDASIIFPFSATAPQFILQLSLYTYAISVATGVVLAVAISCVFLVFYLLARGGKIWPLLVSLLLVVLDSLFLVYIMITLDEISYYMIDAAFHIWVLGSLVRLILTRRKKAQEEAQEEVQEEKHPAFVE